jgi:putative ABC transport system permease protein
VRAAIGAGRGRLVRQFVTESLLLAVLGSIGGITVAVVSVRALVAASPVPVPRVEAIGIDGRLLAFAIALAAATALAFGVVPAWLMARGDVQRPLKESGRGADGGNARARARSLLVVGEVALAVMLLVGAMLLARSFQQLVRQDPGFAGTQAVTAKVELPYSYEDWNSVVGFYDRLLASLRTEAGVSAVGASNFLPLDAAWRGPFFIDGRPHPRAGEEPQAQHQTVDEGYFHALGVPLVAGRFFEPRDTAEAPGVVIVNDVLAKRQWPGESPIGKTLQSPIRVIGPMGRSLMKTTRFEVVGVVASMKNSTLMRDAEPALYYTFRQFPFRGMNVVMQAGALPGAAIAAIRAAVQRLDPNLPISQAQTVDRIVSDATDRPRALMFLMAVFAALALLLAALGVYSVMAYGVSQRRQELSVRLALGAQPRDVVWLVVRQGAILAATGAALGAAGAIASTRALSALLYGVPPTDRVSFATAIALSALTALAACIVPAWRAATMDPLRGLRAE